MRKSLALILFVFITALFNSAFAWEGSQPGPEADYIPGEILVRFRRDVPPATSRAMIQSLGMKVLSVLPGLEVQRLKLPPGAVLEEIIRKYREDANVEFAERNYIYRICAPVNDPDYGLQWALPQIDAPEAWSITTGSPHVIIAILDTGVHLLHQDLEGKIVPGFDFVDNDDRPQDADGHGTHVAGIAAAMTNTLPATGIAGVDWQARIMPVRVLHPWGGTAYDVASGIIFAANNGAQVINLSLGGAFPSRAMEEAVRYAHQRGVVIVAAAGNEAGPVLYPAAYDRYVLAVAATDDQDRQVTIANHGWGSNFGPEVDVAAPGVDIFSTYWVADGTLNSYTSLPGTSMAAPHVAGLASLLMAHDCRLINNPDEVMARIKGTADDVNSATHPGRDDYLGWGRINVHRALLADMPAPLLKFVSYSIDDDTILPPGFWGGNNDNNKVAGPGETVELIVTLRNLWGEATGVSATLSSTALDIITISGDGNAGFLDIEPGDPTPFTIDRGHQADNSANPYVFSVVADDELIGTRVSFTLEIRIADVYHTTHHFSIIINDIQPSILLVDDDGGRPLGAMWGFEGFFRDTLESIGFGYTVWDVQQQGSPGFEDLKDWHIVIWTTADVRINALTTIEQQSLMKYLEGGGRLYLSSMDALYGLYHHTGRFADFGTYYLKVASMLHDADHEGHLSFVNAEGVGGGPISRGMVGDRRLTFNYGDAGMGNWSDWFTPSLRDGAIPIFQEGIHGRICGLKYVGHYALVFLPFAFEAVKDNPYPSNQRVLLDRIIRWLHGVELGPDNQAPRVPQWLTVTDSIGGVSLSWRGNFEPDVREYKLYYRITGHPFPSPGDEDFRYLATVPGDRTFYRHSPPFVDGRVVGEEIIGSTYYYKIKAVDEDGNESDFSGIVSVTPTPAPAGGGDGGGGGGCFIATVVYGTSLAPEVRVLANFRDRHLLRHTFGRKLVAFYEHHSPQLATYISTRPVLKAAVRGILRPLIWFLAKIEH